MLRRASLFLLSLLASATALATDTAAAAGWQSLGENPSVSPQPDGILLSDGKTTVSITAAAPDIIRVRYAPVATLPADRSFAVINATPEPVKVQLRTRNGVSELDTGRLKVQVRHAPFAVEFFDAAGRSLDKDDTTRGTAHADTAMRVWKRLRDDENVYGFGEKTGRLNKRGWSLGGYQTVMWNSDTFAYDSSTDPLYVSVPFYLVLRQGRAHGIFLDNSFRSSFDVGRERAGLLSFGVDGGELDYYFIDGPEPKAVIERYTALTGRMPLPPRWALGFHQSRWSYYPEARLRLLADTFRSKQIPADALWLDIDYLEGFTPFVWNRQYFPAPEKLIGDLSQQGFRVVTIVDPHPKKQPGYHVYDQGLAGNHFVRNADGSVFEGPVWPINAKQNPANSVFPDFTRAATREWWGGLHRELVEQGVAGIWNDMNEPAVWIPPANTMPLDVRHDNDGAPTDQREIHNVYGMLHNRATFDGLLKLKPESRPFVLTRATFAGGQRYAAVWPGDNTADWASLRQSLPTLMGLGLSGFPFVGADIGGFAGVPSGELFSRWLQAAVFSPFMRAHTEQATPDQEPWSYGSQFEAINRRTIELRYQLLPHIYNVMEEASRTGLPALRPLLLEYPDDANVWSRDDQYLFGADLLAAPVLSEAAQTRDVYLPAGDWYEVQTGKRFAGGHHKLPVTLDSLPLFARAGTLLFRQPTVQHTGQMAGATLQVEVYPALASQSSLYEDDGESHRYRAGDFRRRLFRQQRDVQQLTVVISAGEGRYQPPSRMLELHLIAEPVPRDGKHQVQHNGVDLPALTDESWRAGKVGWVHQQGQLRLRIADAMTEHRFRILRGAGQRP